ncbi:hypothetical protein [Pedobacter arcticus]|uniref:hypothetical protein n=1 Tax=Pedobacter arcticus TaxID=752140 RepID=UPI00036C16BC|nr:hypothetical protein [Pedobacter arcticus]
MQQPRRRISNSFFGAKITEPDKFIATVIAVIVFLVGITITASYQITKFYLQQEFNEKTHQQDRAFDNMQRDLKTELKDCEDNNKLVTKEDLENFKQNVERSFRSEKK